MVVCGRPGTLCPEAASGSRRLVSGVKRSTGVLHQEDEVKVVGGAREQLGDEMEVEVAGVVGLGVDEQAATADLVAQIDEPGDHVGEQPGAEAVALVLDVDAEASEQGDGLGVAAGALAESCRSRLEVELRHAPGVVGDDLAATGRGVTTKTLVLPDDADWRAWRRSQSVCSWIGR